MNPKTLTFGDDGQKKLIEGITKISKTVKSTLGSSGNTVLMESPNHTQGLTVTKDGVTVAKSIELIDPVENLAVRMMREAAERTASSAGDGTTTSIVLAEAFVKCGFEHMTDNRTQLLRDITNETKFVIGELKKKSRSVSKKRLKDVAIISSNNDHFVGGLISKCYNEVGKDGIVTVEKSDTPETYYKTTDGIRFDRGYTTPLFINDQKKDEVIFENDVRLLVSDAEISNVLQIEKVLEPVIKKGQSLLIIAPTSVNVTNTLAANVMKRNLKIATVPPPQFGYRQHELMQDIAVATGATYFSEKTGDDLSLITEQDLGLAHKVVVSRDDTILIKHDSIDPELVTVRVNQLLALDSVSNTKADKEFILSRVAALTGSIGQIFVGGNSDIEQKELFDRVEDAVLAVRSATEEGILSGGGVALAEIATKYCCGDTPLDKIMYKALRSPMIQICANALQNGDSLYPDNMFSEKGVGYDMVTLNRGNMINMGIIDPTKVTRQALQNAVSVAVTILSTNSIVTIAREGEV